METVNNILMINEVKIIIFFIKNLWYFLLFEILIVKII